MIAARPVDRAGGDRCAGVTAVPTFYSLIRYGQPGAGVFTFFLFTILIFIVIS